MALASLVMTRCVPSRDSAKDDRREQVTCYTVEPAPTVTPVDQHVKQTDVLSDTVEVDDLDPDTVKQARSAVGRERLRACWLRLEVLAQQAEGEIEQSQQAREGLGAEHRAALDELVEVGELGTDVAEQVQIAFAEAAFHVWRSNAPITCYEGLPAAYKPRDDLVLQAQALVETTDDLDPRVVERVQAAIARDVAFFGAVEVGESQVGELAALWESGEIEASPEAIEAARFLIELLLEG
jgi:hypothetical protein